MRALLRTVALAASAVAVAACGGDASEPADAVEVTADRCVVRLHGKGSGGSAPSIDADGIAVLAPDGNGTGWGARQWDYGSDAEIEAAAGIVSTAVDDAGCASFVVHGFSNGASMATALLCSDAALDDRLAGVIIDDPVTDASSEGCGTVEVPVAIYWTGALAEQAPPGTRCESLDWTCDGDVVRGVDAYAADIGVEVTPSPFDDHEWYIDSPLPLTWLE